MEFNNSRIIDMEALLKTEAKRIGIKVKLYREEKGWSPIDLAFYSNLSQQTIYNVETTHENITLKTLINLSASLGVTIADLMKD